MMTNNNKIFSQLLKSCLDKFEEHETAMLAWGDTESFFTKDEVFEIISGVVQHYATQNYYFEVEEIFLSMTQEKAMLIEIPHPDKANGDSGFFRTRMAEAVHLFKLQRQLFWAKKLEDSKTLVSDFRFVRRPRSYPRRDIEPVAVKQQFSQSSLRYFLTILDNVLKDQFKLSGFQARSLSRILKEYQRQVYESQPQTSPITGSIVCAGTGSGKTLSFYLPGLTALVDHLCNNPAAGVRILAIYPRQELLKDQFYETWKQCRELDAFTQQTIGRKIRIGALFGNTPDFAQNQQTYKSSLNFDLLHCTTPKCLGEMQWQLDDIKNHHERLCCNVCNFSVGNDEILLTRTSQQKMLPDILFTTTEMLSQHLGNPKYRHLFGIGQRVQKPVMVLMDEVHTYEGTTGAQTAYLLRRWLKASQAKPHFVGLSATLNDAANFFAMLIGTSSNQVVLLEPSHDEMVDEGAEYILLLRGDPVSQTALLSTTIQTAMLTRRILDTKEKKSEGVWGHKTFIFNDDLDANNRLFHALIDAEGWKLKYGKLEPKEVTSKSEHRHKPLAAIRARHSGLEESRRRRQISFGQDWRICQQIGHALDEHDRAKVSRTSSQDSGVDIQAEVVVATASLEVGFNDPGVGAVIQYKAPRGVASFLQRKGRAGRSREMRPWLIVVLSEFGRDRYMFQRYEELINPQVKRRSLPLDNRHIQKMQAAMTLLDWLAKELNCSIWNIFKYPKNSNHSILKKVEKKLEALLDDQREFEGFKRYLKSALKVDDEVMQSLLWESPRSVMLSVVPTILCQLKTHWRVNNVEWAGIPNGRSPLPEYIPDALFADLNVPDVNVRLVRGRDVTWQSLGFYQGMREFAPGRLSKRYAIQWNSCDWLIPLEFNPANAFDGDYHFEITEAFGEDLYDEGMIVTEDQQTIRIFRPKEIHTRVLDNSFRLKDKSNAMIQWLVQFHDDSTLIEQPPKGSWLNYLKEIKFCLHKNATPVEVTRYSHTTKATLDFQSRDQRHINFIWHKQEDKVAIGARQWVDGICFSFEIAKANIHNLLQQPQIQQSMRILLFKERLKHCISFKNNIFTANWVYECYMAALAALMPNFRAEDGGLIRQVVNHLTTPPGKVYLQQIPHSLFHSDVENDDSEQKLQKELIELFDANAVMEEITRCASALWQDIDELIDLIDFTYQITENSLAATCYQTLFTLLNDADERSVLVDVEHKEEKINIWLTESEQGGCGIISTLAELYLDDPRRVLNVFMKHLRAGEYEQIDFSLYQLLQEIQQSIELQKYMADVRIAPDYQARKQANKALQGFLVQHGYILSQSFLNLLYSRVLRPGSNTDTDLELLKLLQQWNALEQQTGLEWALNLFTHTMAAQQSKTKKPEDIFERHCTYQSLLWPRGQVVRNSELTFYNQFNSKNLTERLLVKQLFSENIEKIILDDNYFEQLKQQLTTQGVADLMITRHSQMSVARAMITLQEQHIDYYGLWLYPRIVALYREFDGIVLRVELAEAAQ